MAIDAGLARSQLAYQAAVERWISAIRTEERLASAIAGMVSDVRELL